MDFTLIWGIVLISLGISMMLNSLFGINIPVFKVLPGFFLIYWGISLIFEVF